jgi:PAS domain S-box-containing protein
MKEAFGSFLTRKAGEITVEEYRDHAADWQPALHVVLLVLAAGSLALAVGIHFLAPGETARMAAPFLMATIAVIALVAYRNGRIQLGRGFLTFGVLAVVALSMAFSGGMRSAATLVIAPLIIAASVISPRTGRRAVWMSGLVLLAIGLAEWLRWLPTVSPLPWGMYLLLNMVVLLVAAGIGRYLNILLHARTEWERFISIELAQEKSALAVRERQLSEKNAFQEALLKAQTDAGLAMFIIEGGRVVYANDAACRIYGYTPEEMRALPSYLELAHPDDRDRIGRNHQRRLRGEQFENNYRISIVSKAGERREADLTAAYMPGPVPRVLVILVDATERVRAEMEIQRLNEQLEARVRERTAELQSANRELESFAYSISHDLRAPLRGIDGFGQLLLEEYGERLDEQGQGYLKRMRGAAQRMGTLIDDILELSRVTRKSMGREQVDLSRMAADILDNKAKSEPQRRVETAVAPGCTATGDAQLLRILLENLIENAWKYTRHATPARIEFGRELVDGESVFFVSDNGVGFDMKYAGRLFGPFQRLHKPEEFEGTGIGLASAARIVHRHGGRIWAEAEPDKGAVFRFTLPTSGESTASG